MKKQMLALAVSAAMLPGVVLAQGPTLYGKLNVAVERESIQDKNGVAYDDLTTPSAAGERTSAYEVESYASRLGVKGDVDLDVGGLEGFYKAEFQIAVDDGANSNGQVFSQRDIYAGLSSSFGSIKAGRFNSPFKKSEGKVDQFNDFATDMGNFMVGQDRFSNSIQYTSPAFAEAVTFNLALIPNENQDDFDIPADGNENGLDDTVSASVVYRKGGVYAAVAVSQDQDEDLLDDQNGASTIDAQRLVFGFEGDAFEVGVLFQTAEENDKVAAANKLGEDTSVVVSGAFTLDRMKFKAQHQTTEADVSGDEVTTTSVGVDYALGKSSKVYLYHGMAELDADETSTFASGLVDVDYSITSAGLEHKF